MMSIQRTAFGVGLLLSAVIACGGEVAAAPVKLDIKAQPMADALNQWAQATGFQVIFPEETSTAGLVAPEVRGQYVPDAALTKLLANSGLRYEYLNDRTVAVRLAKAEGAESSKSNATEEDSARPLGFSPAQGGSRQDTGANEQNQSNSSASAGAEESGTKLEEIVVTATKRQERLQDVPLSIAVVTAEDIDRRGMVNAEDYLRGIPGVNQVDSSSNQTIVIRGIETSPVNQNAGSGATTATYFGETPTTRTAGLGAGTNVDLKLVDIERVEVIRGPQGTAFGNSSMGGAVRTIPAAPKLSRFEGKVAGGYSATSGVGGDNYNIQAVGNVPLIKDRLAIRATAYRYEDSGFYRNVAGSDAGFRARAASPWGAQAFAVDEAQVGSYSALGGRIAALFQATDDLRFTVSYLSQKTELDGFALANSGTYEQTLFQVAPEHIVRGQKEGVLDTDIAIANATVEYSFGWANLLATYSHTDSGSRRTQPLNSANFGYPISSDSNSDHRENVGEIRVVSNLDGAWNFLAGVYVEKIEDEVLFDFRWFGNPAADFFAPGQTFLGASSGLNVDKQKAAFGEVSWEFLPGLTLTGGVRAYDYERSGRLQSRGPFLGNSTTIGDSDLPAGENFRANLSYKIDDQSLLYAGWSQGFRLGRQTDGLPPGQCDRNGDGIIDGTNIDLASTKNIDSDSLDSYELGGKFTLLDRRLTIDAAVFRMDWSDIPVQVAAGTLATGCGLVYVTNAGKARSEGVELQASLRIIDAVRVDLGGSWTDAKLTKDAPALSPPAFEGDRLPASPKVNANLGLQYEFDIGGNHSSVRVDSIYVGTFHGDLQESPNTESGDYVKVDLSARVAVKNLNLDLFIRNVTNEDAFTFRDAVPRANFFGYRLRPRTVGFQLGYRF